MREIPLPLPEIGLIAGTRVAGIRIRDVECVRKTYPAFIEDLKRLSPNQ